MSARRREPERHLVGDLFTFALFGIFTVLSLLIVVIGVDGYRNIVNTGESVGEIRTTLGYIAGKVRSDSAAAGIRIEQVDGTDVLVLTEVYDDTPYETAIYHRDGYLHEIYRNTDEEDLDIEYGERLIAVSGVTMAFEEENLLAFTATATDGRTQTLHVALRQEEVTP